MVFLDGGSETLIHLSFHRLGNVGVLTDTVSWDVSVRIMSLLLHLFEVDVKVLPKLLIELELLHINMVRPIHLIQALHSYELD